MVEAITPQLPTLEGFRYVSVSMIVPYLTHNEAVAWDKTGFGDFKDERYESRMTELSNDYSLRNPWY